MIENWFNQLERDLRASGDERRVRIADIRHEMYQIRETNPDRMLGLIAEGFELSRILDEPALALYFSVRRAEALMLYKGDIEAGLEQAVRNSLEARKSLYNSLPWRFSVHNELVVGYLYTDPAGYADLARQALDWLEEQARAVAAPSYLILARRRWLAWELGNLDEAIDHARQSLALAASDNDTSRARFYTVFAYSVLCHIAWQREDWEWLDQMSSTGVELAEQSDTQLERCEFLMWQAVLRRREGNTKQAQRFHRQACSRLARIGKPADCIYFDALCAYHDLAGEQEEAVAARDAELAILVGHHRHRSEVTCRIDRCRRLARLGRLTDADLEAARSAARRLRLPEQTLATIDTLQAGDFR